MSKFLDEAGVDYVESLMITKLNFECCFSLFD